ncbi:MAG: hypothetical protein ABIJ91_01240 [Candidatus Kuenenbacteria bacterium]
MQKEDQNLINEEIPEWKIKSAYFYANHKILIKRTLTFLFFFADVIIISLFAKIFVDYRAGITNNDNQMRALQINLINHQTVKQSIQPDQLIIEDTYILSSAGGNYDIFASVKNSNKNWAITQLKYTFVINGKEKDVLSAYILPDSHKYLAIFNLKDVKTAELKIVDTQWKRITDYTLLSYKDSIKIDQASYKKIDSDIVGGQAQFTIKNNSPYSFWEVGIFLVLNNQRQESIGINYLSVDKLLSQEEREIKINWPQSPAGQVWQVMAYPDVDLLSSSSIMKRAAPIGSPPGKE